MKVFEAADIRQRIGKTDAYARLSSVWRERIAVEGAPPASQIGVFTTPGRVWMVFAVAPAVRNALFLLRSIIDAADNDNPLLFAPALLVAQSEDTILWVDVVSAHALASRLELSWRCARFVGEAFGLKVVGVGPKGG